MRSSVAVSATRTCSAPAHRRSHRVPRGCRSPASHPPCPGTAPRASPTDTGPASEWSTRNPASSTAARSSVSAPGVDRSLHHDMRVVGESGGSGRLDRTGHHHAEMLADGQQLPDELRVAGHQAGAVAGEIGSFGQGVKGQYAVCGPSAHRRVQHRNRLRLPARARCSTHPTRRSRRVHGPRPQPWRGARPGAPARSDWPVSSPRSGQREPGRQP